MNHVHKSLISLLRIILALILLVPLGFTLQDQWNDVYATMASIQLGNAGVGLLVAIVAQPLMGLISWFVLLDLGFRKPYRQVLWLYFTSQLAKYLPGGIWAFPGRIVAYQVTGVDRLSSIVALIREVAALYLGASAVGLSSLFLGVPVGENARWVIGIGVALSTVGVVLTQMPFFWRMAFRLPWLKQANLSLANLGESRLSARWLITTVPSSVAFWLLTGLGFWVLTRAIIPQAVQIPWYQATGMFALAWCVGFVIIVAPAGLGVRESTLTLLLSSFLPLSESTAIAILARLWWTLAEAPFILFALLWVSRQTDLRQLTGRSSQKHLHPAIEPVNKLTEDQGQSDRIIPYRE